MRRTFGLLALVVVLLAGGLVETAAARLVVTTRDYPGPYLVQGPKLTAGGVAWLTYKCLPILDRCDPGGVERDSSERYELLVRNGSREPLVVAHGRVGGGGSGPNYGYADASFLASQSHFAVRWNAVSADEFSESTTYELRAGPVKGPLRRLLRCETEKSAHLSVALAGPWIAHDATPCAAGRVLVIRNLDTGESWPFSPPEGTAVYDLTGDGHYLAVRLGPNWEPGAPPPATRVVVIDTSLRAIDYEVALPGEPRVNALDLAADGSVSVVSGQSQGRCDGRLTLYSSTVVQGEPVHPEVCGLLATLPGQVVIKTREAGADRLTLATPQETRTLVALGNVRLAGADAEGNRIAWAIRDCGGGVAIHLDRLTIEGLDAGPTRCPVGLATRRLAASADGRLQARLRCPRGCSGRLKLLLGRRTIAAHYFNRLRGERRPVPLRLSRTARARLLAAGTLRVNARIRVSEPDRT